MTLPTPEQLEAAAKLLCEMAGPVANSDGFKKDLIYFAQCAEALRQAGYAQSVFKYGGKAKPMPFPADEDSPQASMQELAAQAQQLSMGYNGCQPLIRGLTGACSRAMCICEKEGLGSQCIWLNKAAKLDAHSLTERITEYLSSGGLFNPEMADHSRVRNLLIDCRDALNASPQASQQAEKVADSRPLPEGEAPENSGMLVEVLRISQYTGTNLLWEIKSLGRPFNLICGKEMISDAEDSRLTPIRDQDGTDETLRVAPFRKEEAKL